MSSLPSQHYFNGMYIPCNGTLKNVHALLEYSSQFDSSLWINSKTRIWLGSLLEYRGCSYDTTLKAMFLYRNINDEDDTKRDAISCADVEIQSPGL
jgi:hypothetical protein